MKPERWTSIRWSIGVLAGLVVLSQVPRILPLADPLALQTAAVLAPPGSAAFPWGTDEIGRDVLSRTLHGLATTLWVSVAAVTSSLAIGAVLGGLAGRFHGSAVDAGFGWVVNLLLSVPFLLIMVAALSLGSPDLVKAYAVLAAIIWVHPARIVRGEVIRQWALPHVQAARALGFSDQRILWLKLMPRALSPAAMFSLSYLPEVVALEAGLSFLGLGVQPPQPGLGKMIFDGLPYLYSAWWLALFPAASLFVTVLVINLLQAVRPPR